MNQVIDVAYMSDVLIRSLSQVTPVTAALEAAPSIQQFIGGFVSHELRKLGFSDLRRDSMGNLLALLPSSGSKDRGSILFVVYAMIHPAGTMVDAFVPRLMDGAVFGIRGEVARGRAACEQRGSFAALLAAVDAVVKSNTERAEIQVLVLSSGETGNHGAAECALRELGIKADGAILAICSDMQVTIAHKGRVDVHIVVEGKAAHSSSPALGISAVDGARWALDRLAAIPLSGPHPALGPATLAVTRIATEPVAAHTIPAQCLLELDLRLLPGEDPEIKVGDISAALEGVPAGTLAVRAGNKMLACEVREDAQLVQSLLRAGESALGKRPKLTCMSAASDAGYFNSVGIPTVCYGAGEIARAHTDDDVVAISDVAEVARVYAELMRIGLKKPR